MVVNGATHSIRESAAAVDPKAANCQDYQRGPCHEKAPGTLRWDYTTREYLANPKKEPSRTSCFSRRRPPSRLLALRCSGRRPALLSWVVMRQRKPRMAMFVHLAPETRVALIRRNGIRRLRRAMGDFPGG